VMAIKTDSTPVEEPKDPDKCNLFQLYRLFAPEDRLAATLDLYRNGGAMYGKIKLELLDLIWDHFAAARSRREELLADPAELRRILARGAEKAREIAVVTMDLVRKNIGLSY